MTEIELRQHEDGATPLAIMRVLEDAGIATATTLDVAKADLPFDQYEAIGRWLGKVRDVTSWWLADWLNQGEAIYGEKYAQAVDATGRSYGALMNIASVGNRVAPNRRRADLSFSHHREIAKLDPADQRKWLARAAVGGWTVVDLVENLRGAGLRESRAQVDPGPLQERELGAPEPDSNHPARTVRCPSCGHEWSQE